MAGLPDKGLNRVPELILFERMGFFLIQEVVNREAVVIFWHFHLFLSFLSILYFYPFMGSGMDSFCCSVLGYECGTGAHSKRSRDQMTGLNVHF